jgi:cell division protein FtsB
MTMTPDTIGAIIAAFGAAATVLAGVLGLLMWFGRKLEARFDKIDDRFGKVDARFDKVDARLDKLADEITDLKVSVARLEGPRPGLQFVGSP